MKKLLVYLLVTVALFSCSVSCATITNENRKISYVVDNTSVFTYAYTFDIISPSTVFLSFFDTDGVEVIVTMVRTTSPTPAANEYYVNESSSSIVIGGTGTLQTQYGVTITQLLITRIVDFTQGTAFPTATSLQSTAIEAALDKNTMISQQLSETQARTLRIPIQDDTSQVVDLPAASIRAGKFLSFDVLGNPTVGDTPAGSVVISAAMEPVVGAATIIVAKTLMNLADIVNVKDYGATGDGTTDDRAAIQAAIDSLTGGGIVFLPPGDYLILAPIFITSATDDPGIRFVGSGNGRLGIEAGHTTRIVNNANTDALVYRSNGGVIIENLTIFDSFGSRTAGAGILGERSVINGVTSAHIRNVVIQGHQDGIRIVRGQQTIVENVVCIDMTRDGFRLEDHASGGGTSVTFRNCFASEVGNDGYSQRAHSYTLFENCASDNAGRHGYFLTSGSGSAVSVTYLACGSEGVTADGFFFDTGVTDVSVIGCLAAGAGDDGLSSSANGLTVIGSKFTANTGYGINIIANQNMLIMNCQNTANSAGQFNDATNRAIFINSKTDNAIDIGSAARIIQGIATLANDGTPSVILANQYITGGTTTITDFDDGVKGQVITIIGQHSTTQITDGANLTLAGSNFVMDSGDTIKLISLDGTEWLELSRSNNN